MIDEYLAAARRVKPASEPLVAHYNFCYESLLGLTKESASNPELYVTYSAERRCELITVGQRTYLVYDQYLGQTFNRLNRIQYATHGSQDLSRALASKYLAERLLQLGSPVIAGFLGMVAHQFENNVKEEGNPFELSRENEATRVNLIVAQELFVIAHELAHFRFSLDQERSSEETEYYINQFLDYHRTLPTEPAATRDHFDTARYYEETLASQQCIPELFADDFGGLIAFQVAVRAFGLPAWQAVAGVVLAFKYLRLFQHLEVVAHYLCDVATVTDPSLFAKSLSKLADDVGYGAQGLRIAQLREHFLRYRLSQNEETSNVSELIGEYDEKTEFPVVFGLVDRLRENLTPRLLAGFAENATFKQDPTAMIDELTGWVK
jgi:hypothetical protein